MKEHKNNSGSVEKNLDAMLSKPYICVCVRAHVHTHIPTPDLKWLSCRILLLGDQTVSPQPHSNLNSDRYVSSVLGMARTNIKGHVYLLQSSTFLSQLSLA